MPAPMLLVVGSVNHDLVLNSPRLPRAGETVTDAVLIESCGGKGANQAVAAARYARRLGGDAPRIVFSGAVGGDPFGRRQIEQLRADGIDVEHLHEIAGVATGTSTIWVESQTGQNRILNAPGANDRFLPPLLDGLPLAQASLLLLQNEIPAETTRALSRLAAEAGVPLLWDPAPFSRGDDLPLDPGSVAIVTPNETEAEALLGRALRDDAYEDEARAIAELGFGTVVLTLGEKGVAVHGRDGGYRVEPPPVRAVDSAAAGDAFSGALAASLISGLDERSAVRAGVAYATESVSRHGTQSSFAD